MNPTVTEAADDLERLYPVARDYFGVNGLARNGADYLGAVPATWTVPRMAAAAVSRLGWFPIMRGRGDDRLVFFARHPGAARDETGRAWPIFLFCATFISLAGVGWAFAIPFAERGLVGPSGQLWMGLQYALAVSFVLLCHEFGHWYAARACAMRATLPYFIPMPLLFGTMGAFIQLRSPAPDRDALIKLGASGPLAGLVAAVLVLAVGLPLGMQMPAQALQGTYVQLGEPLLYQGLAWVVGAARPPGFEVIDHPIALAGWLGLLLTALNLLPAGQLDGGHVARAYLSERTHRVLGYVLGAVLIAMAPYTWPGWYLWGGIAILFGHLGNPGGTDESPPVTKAAHWMAGLSLIAFILCFMPMPLRIVTLGGG